MNSTALLLSIRPKYADLIFNGLKKTELRRVRPRIQKGGIVLIYVSSPVKALMGAFQVQKVIEGNPKYLWRVAGNESGITKKEFDTYYSGLSLGFAISASKIWQLKHPILLANLKRRWAHFTPPQGYRYIHLEEIEDDILPPILKQKAIENPDGTIPKLFQSSWARRLST